MRDSVALNLQNIELQNIDPQKTLRPVSPAPVFPAFPAFVPAPDPIPFNRFGKVGTEFAYIQQAIDALHISGDGRFTALCHGILERATGARKALLTTSCTHALEMAALLLNIQPGDEVIIPSFTFVSTANAFVLRGAVPVFCDIRPDTLNLDESRVESLITPRTRAIVPVHYGGVGCEMDAICEIAARRGIAVVEDNAHGLFGFYKGKPLGSFGALATLSFHETKNFSCGEGGALLINDPAMIDRAEILREKGTNRKRFFRGEVDRYSWVDTGSSYLPSEILAAVLYAQLEARAQIRKRRRNVWEFYAAQLTDWAAANGVGIPRIPAHCESSHHCFHLLLPTAHDRPRLIEHLKAKGILSVFHYLPLHLSEMGRKFGGVEGDCPVCEDISERLLRLPFYNTLDFSTQWRIVGEIKRFDLPRGSDREVMAS
ncbi:MAG TPA: dTDP-4-amino-4,6-dideoxygalactose transaminase [Bryobacteraceae bacterium]|nr:dTDP-4-amino-4,6-dideoxygalactose transaminase [Bryobacteraceae bacterium]